MGYAPEWYPLAAASRYWGVPPWVMAHQPAVWVARAEAMARAENHADAMHSKLGS